MDKISETHLTELFDQLVAEDVIVYGPHTKHVLSDEDYPVRYNQPFSTSIYILANITLQIEFRISPSLLKKPHSVTSSNPSFNHTRKLGPGSDMFCPDERLNLCKVNRTHDLALNLFCVDRPQLLMTTCDSYRRQHERLDVADFRAMLQVLNTWSGWYVIFNCGELGGCSRVHKHVQGLRGPPFAFEVLKDGQDKVPYKFFLHRFEQGFRGLEVELLEKTYEEMLGRCRDVLGIEDKTVCPPHNVVLWDDCIVVIPRRKGVFEGAAANTGGMLGSVWVSEEKEMEKWVEIGCANVLRELGVPR
jgi:ATP adenylyltransferase/5',5'''-P-1,P-4-tetraphosphate phosphorylase II